MSPVIIGSSDYEFDKAKILEYLKYKEGYCKDLMVRLDDLHFDCNLGQYLQNDQESPGHYQSVAFTDHAEGQLLQRLGIPAGYFHKCSTEVQGVNINYWLKKKAYEWARLRYMEEKIRAVFSNRYSFSLDDIRLFPAVFEALEVAENKLGLRIEWFEHDENITQLDLVIPIAVKDPDIECILAGIKVINSEVGASSVWIKPSIRLSSGLYWRTLTDCGQEGTYAFRHVGYLSQSLISEGIERALEVSQVGVLRILQANQEIVKDPIKETRDLVKQSDFLTQTLGNIIEEECRQNSEITRLKLVRIMLEAISDLPLIKKIQAEGEIGRFMNLFQDTEQRKKGITSDLMHLQALEID